MDITSDFIIEILAGPYGKLKVSVDETGNPQVSTIHGPMNRCSDCGVFSDTWGLAQIDDKDYLKCTKCGHIDGREDIENASK